MRYRTKWKGLQKQKMEVGFLEPRIELEPSPDVLPDFRCASDECPVIPTISRLMICHYYTTPVQVSAISAAPDIVSQPWLKNILAGLSKTFSIEYLLP